MRHEPCTPVRNLQHPVKLVRGHSLLAGAEQMIGKQPFPERDVTVLEDRAHGDGELLTASATLPHAFTNVLVLLGRFWLQPIGIIQNATVWANRAIGPAQLLKKLPRLVFIAKVLSQSN